MAKIAQVNTATLAVLAVPMPVSNVAGPTIPAHAPTARIAHDASGTLWITLPPSSGQSIVEIVDVRGKVIERRTIPSGTLTSSISCRGHGPGSYVFILSSSGIKTVKKITIVR